MSRALLEPDRLHLSIGIWRPNGDKGSEIAEQGREESGRSRPEPVSLARCGNVRLNRKLTFDDAVFRRKSEFGAFPGHSTAC